MSIDDNNNNDKQEQEQMKLDAIEWEEEVKTNLMRLPIR